MKLRTIISTILAAITAMLSAQQTWSLEQCVDYAIQNNITVQKMALQRDNQELNLKTSKLSFVPNLNANVGQNFSFGRATGNDNITTSQSMGATSFGVSTSMPIFTG